MLSPTTEALLLEVLSSTDYVESQVEVIRQLLCEQSHFNPYICFKLIDQQSNQTIQPNHIRVFLYKHRIYFKEEQCKLLINNYDLDEDGFLNYAEFLKILLPIHNKQLRNKIIKIQPTSQNDSPNIQIEYTLAKLFEKEIILSDSLEEEKKKLRSCPDFSSYSAFKFFTSQNSIYWQDLEKYNAQAAFKRIDLKNDGFIDESEFSRFFEGLPFTFRTRGLAPTFSDDKAFNVDESDLIQNLMERMSVIEQYKQNIASQKDFNLFDGFKLIDQQKKGIVGQVEFNRFLNIDDFAINKEFKFSHFIKLIQPEEGGSEILSRKPGSQISDQTRQLLKNLLLMINDAQKYINLVEKHIPKSILEQYQF